MYQGPCGLNALNTVLRSRLTSGATPAGRFLIGEKLVATKNAYDVGLMNGQIVWVRGTNGDGIVVETDAGESLDLDAKTAGQLKPAWAVSVHRGQGGEVPAAVIVAHTSAYTMLPRALIYTAVTRARQMCVVVGQRRALEIAVRRAVLHNRHSHLQVRLNPTTPEARAA